MTPKIRDEIASIFLPKNSISIKKLEIISNISKYPANCPGGKFCPTIALFPAKIQDCFFVYFKNLGKRADIRPFIGRVDIIAFTAESVDDWNA